MRSASVRSSVLAVPAALVLLAALGCASGREASTPVVTAVPGDVTTEYQKHPTRRAVGSVQAQRLEALGQELDRRRRVHPRPPTHVVVARDEPFEVLNAMYVRGGYNVVYTTREGTVRGARISASGLVSARETIGGTTGAAGSTIAMLRGGEGGVHFGRVGPRWGRRGRPLAIDPEDALGHTRSLFYDPATSAWLAVSWRLPRRPPPMNELPFVGMDEPSPPRSDKVFWVDRVDVPIVGDRSSIRLETARGMASPALVSDIAVDAEGALVIAYSTPSVALVTFDLDAEWGELRLVAFTERVHGLGIASSDVGLGIATTTSSERGSSVRFMLVRDYEPVFEAELATDPDPRRFSEAMLGFDGERFVEVWARRDPTTRTQRLFFSEIDVEASTITAAAPLGPSAGDQRSPRMASGAPHTAVAYITGEADRSELHAVFR